MRQDHATRYAAERLDVLEVELPAGRCQARGCEGHAAYEWAGAWRVFWLCPSHWRAYRVHDVILKRILAIPEKAIY